MAYHYPSCDLYMTASGPEVYRLNLEQGRFLAPLVTNSRYCQQSCLHCIGCCINRIELQSTSVKLLSHAKLIKMQFENNIGRGGSRNLERGGGGDSPLQADIRKVGGSPLQVRYTKSGGGGGDSPLQADIQKVGGREIPSTQSTHPPPPPPPPPRIRHRHVCKILVRHMKNFFQW